MDFVFHHGPAVEDVHYDHHDAANQANMEEEPFVLVVRVAFSGVILLGKLGPRKGAYKEHRGENSDHVEEQDRLLHHADFVVEGLGFPAVFDRRQRQFFVFKQLSYLLVGTFDLHLTLHFFLTLLYQFINLARDDRLPSVGLSEKVSLVGAVR